MNYILFDGSVRNALLPFTYTKPVADLRVGILTIREKWEKHLGFTTTTLTEEYLEEKYPMVEMERNIMINASFLPTPKLIEIITNLKENQAVFKNDEVIAFFTTEAQDEVNFEEYDQIEFDTELLQIKNTWDLFSLNEKAIKADFDFITEGRKSQPIPKGVNYLNKDDIFIEEGAEILFSTLNASTGPIYVGKDAIIMEGSLIRGPFSLGSDSAVKMGSKIYGATTIGPNCTVGGEVKNSILMSFSNKGHEGYLGNSVLGEWCNIGADSNNSNLKNNYAQVRLWSYETEGFAKTGLQFCGLIMGDHSKCAINTMFNTGTVVGVSANIYGSNFPRNFIPSFSWGGAAGFSIYQINKAIETASLVLERKGLEFNEQEKRILQHVFEMTEKYRNF
ncbi:UDP-N-acetylglucosamine diphosphorylase/glucosamine-1-phosphate N-acetyltransferase [Lutibacter oceani]|uniref:UDP-N-acetylglucosamine diphosphorylase/glucosamine-1-phosphate N-acetyltransferase n=1 Tax=Lutibacter oceani TaxID=1853311 RepID=A0A3D9RT35_9FLAO|nr:GlmU family protein [Lutibacter oceani]REE79855.1 UDP-N-acetylglucosamine diphosphorylase/glucosamine-1-phosphate N-acetyltransferase [Lutibacter oceani]